MLLKVVLDTSVIISAFYKPAHQPSFSRVVFDYAARYCEVIISEEILVELRDKCTKRLKLNLHQTALLELNLLRYAKKEKIKDCILSKNIGLRDKNDLHILELAVGHHADLILTWDKDLLILDKVKKTKILSPRDFWNSFQS